jgi:magnesium-transporting ATPase (P-type)
MSGLFHQLPVEQVVTELKTRIEGLSNAEVERRRKEFGRNEIPKQKSRTLLGVFIRQFLNPLIYVLLAAAVVSGVTGDINDAIFITVIVLINSILGTYQEWRAENSAKALRDLVRVKCRVRRDNRIFEVDSEDVVPGDVVILESGSKVPADLRLLEAKDLSIEEALLTGESEAVTKDPAPVKGGGELALGDRLNMAYAATTIQKGRGLGIVVAIAKDTEIGKIAGSLSATEP